MPNQNEPCRLFVYLAREAPVAVVLRRGPTDWARLSLWRTDTDTFEHGQWFHGRIYERRSDISADGSRFVYFALKIGGRRGTHPQWQDSWVAISRPPRFTARALWFIGGTYCTGGFFPEDKAVWIAALNQPPDVGELPDDWELSTSRDLYIDHTNNWPERTVYQNRLHRDGWEPIDEGSTEGWQRENPAGVGRLVMAERDFDFQAYGGPYVVEYSLTSEGRELLPLGRATWADWDQNGRLVIAQDGQLTVVEHDGTRRMIADFNGQVAEPRP